MMRTVSRWGSGSTFFTEVGAWRAEEVLAGVHDVWSLDHAQLIPPRPSPPLAPACLAFVRLPRSERGAMAQEDLALVESLLWHPENAVRIAAFQGLGGADSVSLDAWCLGTDVVSVAAVCQRLERGRGLPQGQDMVSLVTTPACRCQMVSDWVAIAAGMLQPRTNYADDGRGQWRKTPCDAALRQIAIALVAAAGDAF